jgi:histidinol-phosphate/aromatic aminotransferase/cobyric acid decarboxylase-like protein
MKEDVQQFINSLEELEHSGQRNVSTLESVSHHLLLIVEKLYNDNPSLWHSVHTGVHHTRRDHITTLRSKSKAYNLESYRLGLEQTLDDLKEVLAKLGD